MEDSMEPLKSLASTVIGKVLLWIITVLLVVIIGMFGWVYLIKADIKVSKSEKEVVQTQLDALADQLTKNYLYYLRRLDEANQTKVIVQKQYIEKIKYIEKMGDHNDTCDEAMRAIDAYQF